jgi:hypothetical protein
MIRRAGLVLTGVLLIGAGTARGREAGTPDPGPGTQAESATAMAGFCDYILGSTDADTVVSLWPHVMAGAALVSGGSETTGDESATYATSLRLIAGLKYDFMDLHQGLTERRHARAECARFRALETANAHLSAAQSIGRRPALEARIRALEEGLPEAAAIQERARARHLQGEVPLGEIDATEMRVQSLRDQLWEGREALAALPDDAPPTRAALEQLAADYRARDRDMEAADAEVRRGSAWSVALRGGYDKVVGSDRLPVFALVSLSYSLGGFGQSRPNRTSLTGREAWIAHSVSGVEQRIDQVVRELKARRDLHQARLRETRVLLADLERRRTALVGMEPDPVREFADFLWFEVVRVRADRAYQEAMTAALDAFLEDRPAGAATGKAG